MLLYYQSMSHDNIIIILLYSNYATDTLIPDRCVVEAIVNFFIV